MEICRAFDIFELVFMVILIGLLIFMSLGMIYISWYESNYGTPESKAKFFSKPTLKGIFKAVVQAAIFFIIYGAYLYIKSMFC